MIREDAVESFMSSKARAREHETHKLRVATFQTPRGIVSWLHGSAQTSQLQESQAKLQYYTNDHEKCLPALEHIAFNNAAFKHSSWNASKPKVAFSFRATGPFY